MFGNTILSVLAFLTVFSPTVSAQAQPDYGTRNLDTIRKIYDLTVYPKNAPIVSQGASAVPAGLFNENAVGRISPVGNFTGFDDSIEYFFGLAPTPDSNPAGVAIYKAEVVEFTSGCADVASSLVYLRTGTVDNTTGQVDLSKPTTTLAQVAFWKFDEQGAVLNYHAWIPNLQTWTEVGNNIDFDNVVIQKAVTAALCPQIQDRCKGKDQQYSDVLSCVAQLELKPFGSFDEAWGDNVVCRQIHLLLTKVRPDVHCPHVGPDGGSAPDSKSSNPTAYRGSPSRSNNSNVSSYAYIGRDSDYKCVDIDYSVDYFDDASLFGAPLGNTFTCGGPLL